MEVYGTEVEPFGWLCSVVAVLWVRGLSHASSFLGSVPLRRLREWVLERYTFAFWFLCAAYFLDCMLSNNKNCEPMHRSVDVTIALEEAQWSTVLAIRHTSRWTRFLSCMGRFAFV